MKIRLLAVIAPVEALLVVTLIYFLNLKTLPDKVGIALVWLLPIALGVHILEEFGFYSGLIEWNRTYRPKAAGSMPVSDYIKINAIGVIAAVLSALGTNTFIGLRLWLAFVTVFAGFNALWHIQGVLRSRHYCPGVITGCLVYLPLTVFSYAYLFKTGALDIVSALVCIAVGPLYQIVTDRIHERVSKERAASSECD
jgi:hypothetical protein